MSDGLEHADNTGREPGPRERADAPDDAGEVLDLAVLLSLEDAQVEGEPDIVVELTELYDEDAPRRLTSIRGALAAGDSTALRRAAHGLRGGSASLGALRMAMLCEKLERLHGAESPHEGEMLLTCLERELARVRLAFAEERSRRLAS